MTEPEWWPYQQGHSREHALAYEAFFDALDAAETDHASYDRVGGFCDENVWDVIGALLEAGWKPPGPVIEGGMTGSRELS